MDKLFEAAKFYKDNLLNKKFHLIAGKKSKIIEFDILFGAGHFRHLTGLHKITDIRKVQINSTLLLNKILKEEITVSDLEASVFYRSIEPRIDNFKDIKATLFSKELMIKSLQGTFNLIRADFMLTEKNEKYGYAHLFLKGSEITVPVTYIINENDHYLRNNPNKWTVLSIEEISSKK